MPPRALTASPLPSDLPLSPTGFSPSPIAEVGSRVPNPPPVTPGLRDGKPIDDAIRQWKAELELEFCFRTSAVDGVGATVLSKNRHAGPLRVQKALYPDGPATATVLLLHPPSGLAGGDDLSIRIDVQTRASVIATTPGATKWYGRSSLEALQHINLSVYSEATLQWLPQESIVFSGAKARSTVSVDVSETGRFLGWDVMALGRYQSGETFSCGTIAQTSCVHRAGRLVWKDRLWLGDGDTAIRAPALWAGHHVQGTLVAVGEGASAALQCWPERDQVKARLGVSSPETDVVVARALGHDPADVRALLWSLVAHLRAHWLSDRSPPPRIWAT